MRDESSTTRYPYAEIQTFSERKYPKATMLMLLFIVLSTLVVCTPPGSTAEGPTFQEEKQRRTREVYKIGVELREAILRRDNETLLKYIVIGPNDFSSYEEARLILQMPTHSI